MNMKGVTKNLFLEVNSVKWCVIQSRNQSVDTLLTFTEVETKPFFVMQAQPSELQWGKSHQQQFRDWKIEKWILALRKIFLNSYQIYNSGGKTSHQIDSLDNYSRPCLQLQCGGCGDFWNSHHSQVLAVNLHLQLILLTQILRSFLELQGKKW